MKLRKQKNKHSCSVIALLNVLALQGKDYSYKHQYAFFSKLLKLDETGTSRKDFDKAIKSFFKDGLKKTNPKIKDLRKYVNNNVVVVLGTDYQGFAHVGIVLKFTKEYVFLCNWGRKHKVIRKVKVDTLKTWMSEWCVAYCIEKT